MTRVLSLLFVIAVLTPGSIRAQAGGGRMEDVETLDGILDAYYEVVSRPVGTAPDRERDEWIHHPDALVTMPGTGADGVPVFQTMTLSEFHDRFGAADADAFFEWEVHRVVQRFGNVAHVWSTYASSREPDGEVFGRGINSIQLYNDGSRWWITSWIFDQERAGNEIPAEFSPRQAPER